MRDLLAMRDSYQHAQPQHTTPTNTNTNERGE
jgi:hypothetical protein